MSGPGHRVMQLDTEFGTHIVTEDACFGYVSNNSGLYNVPNDELLNGFVLEFTLGTAQLVAHGCDPFLAQLLFLLLLLLLLLQSSWRQDRKELLLDSY